MITRDEIEIEITKLGFNKHDVYAIVEAIMEAKNPCVRLVFAQLRNERERKQIMRDFWINIFIGGALLFLAMICLEIVT